jgi:FAD synthase
MKRQKLPANLQGTTTRFAGTGRTLGYPTANITTDTNLADGIYFGFACLGQYKNRPSLIFIGEPLTLQDHTRRVEAFLLNIPDEDYYDLPLELELCVFHRANQAFANRDELVRAMKADEVAALQWFNERRGAILDD